MKKIVAGVAMVLILLGAYGCQQKKEQKQQPMNYTPAVSPMLLEIDQLQKAANMAPKSVQAWTKLGDSLMDSQRFSEAIDAYDKSLALEPKNVNVLVDQGTCYRGVGKFDKALEQYRKALKVDPNFPNAHLNMGVVLAYDLGNKAEGLKAFKKYIEVAPNAPNAPSIRQTIQELSAGK